MALGLQFVRRVAVAVDEGDGDRLDILADQRLAGGDHAGLRQRLDLEPSAAMRSATSIRCRLGTNGFGFSQVRSNMSGMRMRPISSTSRKPRVVISPVLRTPALQNRVRTDGGPVQNFGNGAGRDRQIGQ